MPPWAFITLQTRYLNTKKTPTAQSALEVGVGRRTVSLHTTSLQTSIF